MTKKTGRPVPYAELRRRLIKVHNFSYKLPRIYVRKKDVIRAKESISNSVRSKELSIPEITNLIKQKARDYAVERNLSPQQKGAIVKLFYGKKNPKHPTNHSRRKGGLVNAIKLVEEKDAIFVPIKKGRNKKLFGRMKKTNKGVFLFEKGVKAKIVGKGKNTRFQITRSGSPKKYSRTEQFFPFPRGVDVMAYIDDLYIRYKPKSLAIGVMSARGSARVKRPNFLSSVEDAIIEYSEAGKVHPFSGVYFYWF